MGITAVAESATEATNERFDLTFESKDRSGLLAGGPTPPTA